MSVPQFSNLNRGLPAKTLTKQSRKLDETVKFLGLAETVRCGSLGGGREMATFRIEASMRTGTAKGIDVESRDSPH